MSVAQPEYEPETERALAPRPNPILAQPSTPAACQQDYADGTDIRQRLGWTDGA